MEFLVQLLTGLHRTWATDVNRWKFTIIFSKRFIYLSVYPRADLKSCVTDVFTWMTNSKLKRNRSKTEFIIIGSKKQREKFKDLFPILLLDHDTLPKAFVRNLGFIFYCDFNFKRQISQTCKICFYHIRDFRHIRKYLSPEAANSVACALVTSHLDYCNSLLYNLSDRDIERLQRVQNCLAV